MVKTQLTLAAAVAVGLCSLATNANNANAQSASPFHLLDRPADDSSVGADFSTLFFTDDIDVVVFRLDPHIEHMLNPNLGLLASIPMSVVVPFGDNEGDTSSAVGNLDAGAFFVSPMSRELTLVFRGSLTLPTASDDLDDIFINIFSSYSRLGDFSLVIPNTVLARPAASLIYRSPSIEFRGDFGLDIPLFATEGDIDDRSPLIRLSGGIAIGSGPTKVIGELVNLIPSDQADENNSSIHQVGIGLSQELTGGGTLTAGVSVVADGFFEEETGDSVSLNLGYKSRY